MTGEAVLWLELVDAASASRLPSIIIAVRESSAEKRLGLLRQGEVDVALNLELGENFDALDLAPPLIWGRVTSTLSAIYYFNCSSGIIANPEARLAADLAINNDKLVEEFCK